MDLKNPLIRALLALLLLVLVTGGLVGTGFWWGSTDKDDEWSLKWAERDRSDAIAAKTFTEQQRRIELKRQGDLDAIQKQADADIAAAKRSAELARVESDKLRAGISSAIARLTAGSDDSTAAAGRPSKAATGVLLTELYQSIDEAAGRYAEQADESYRIGLVCERSYDAVRSAK